jgi:hypothetical protein
MGGGGVANSPGRQLVSVSPPKKKKLLNLIKLPLLTEEENKDDISVGKNSIESGDNFLKIAPTA